MKGLRQAVSFLGVAVILASASPAAALPQRRFARVPVVNSGADEYLPAADGTYVAWTANTFQRKNRFNVYFSVGGGPKQRVNPPGTQADTGGIDGTELIYTQYTPDEVDLALYDLETESVLPTPTGVNTGRHEFSASNSGDYLLFDRDLFTRRRTLERIVLHNTSTTTETILAESENDKFLVSGQVNGDWAVYVVCGRTCNVFRYDITGESASKVPNPGDKQQYAASVSEAGVVYFARSAPRCGQNVRFMTWDGASDPALFRDLPDGKDSFDTFYDNTGSSLYFERINCRDFSSDIFSEPVL